MTTFNDIKNMLDRDGMYLMFCCNEVLKAKYEALQWEMRNAGEKQGEVTERDGNLFQLLTDIQLLLKAMQADDDLDSALKFHAKYIARNERTAEQEKQIVAMIKQNMKDMTQLIDEAIKTSHSSTYAQFSKSILDASLSHPPRAHASHRESQMLDRASSQQAIIALREFPHLTPHFINILDSFSLKELEQYRAEMYKQVLGSVVKEYDDVRGNNNATQDEITTAKNKFMIAKNELLKDPLFEKLQEKIKEKGISENKKVTIFEPEKIESLLEKPSGHSRLKGAVDRTFRRSSSSASRKSMAGGLDTTDNKTHRPGGVK